MTLMKVGVALGLPSFLDHAGGVGQISRSNGGRWARLERVQVQGRHGLDLAALVFHLVLDHSLVEELLPALLLEAEV